MLEYDVHCSDCAYHHQGIASYRDASRLARNHAYRHDHDALITQFELIDDERGVPA